MFNDEIDYTIVVILQLSEQITNNNTGGQGREKSNS